MWPILSAPTWENKLEESTAVCCKRPEKALLIEVERDHLSIRTYFFHSRDPIRPMINKFFFEKLHQVGFFSRKKIK